LAIVSVSLVPFLGSVAALTATNVWFSTITFGKEGDDATVVTSVVVVVVADAGIGGVEEEGTERGDPVAFSLMMMAIVGGLDN
jgi:hypothetical protein